jgi:hypothetical protein
MNSALQLRWREKLGDVRLRKRPVGQVPKSERVNLVAERNLARKWIFSAIDALRQDDVCRLVPREITGVYSERILFGCGVGVVQAEVAGEEVGPAVLVEITGGEAVPPTAHWG